MNIAITLCLKVIRGCCCHALRVAVAAILLQNVWNLFGIPILKTGSACDQLLSLLEGVLGSEASLWVSNVPGELYRPTLKKEGVGGGKSYWLFFLFEEMGMCDTGWQLQLTSSKQLGKLWDKSKPTVSWKGCHCAVLPAFSTDASLSLSILKDFCNLHSNAQSPSKFMCS